MRATDILLKFYNQGKNLGYTFLKEGSVVRDSEAETLFNMSAISEHIYLFDNLEQQDDYQGYYTSQMSYFPNKLDGVGINRLTNPMEVGLSFFMLNTNSPVKFLKNSIEYLSILRLDVNKLFIRCDSESDFAYWYSRAGIEDKKIFEWDNLEKFHIGKNRPQGYYSYLYYKYLNGIVPIGAIAVLQVNGKYQFDVVFYLERLSLIIENKDSIWEISEIYKLVNLLEEFNIGIINIERFALFFRISVFLVSGGLHKPSNNKHGFCLKKILRELGFLLSGQQFNEEQKTKLINSASYLIVSMGYRNLSKLEKNVISENIDSINKYSKDIFKRLVKVKMIIESGKIIQYEKLKSEFGVYPEWINIKFSKLLKELGVEVPIKERNSIRSKALGIDNTVVNIKKILEE